MLWKGLGGLRVGRPNCESRTATVSQEIGVYIYKSNPIRINENIICIMLLMCPGKITY
jgi:hypothetical protein